MSVVAVAVIFNRDGVNYAKLLVNEKEVGTQMAARRVEGPRSEDKWHDWLVCDDGTRLPIPTFADGGCLIVGVDTS